MPSNTMLEVMARKKQQLEAQEALEKSQKDKVEQPQDDEPEDETTPDETSDDLDADDAGEDDGNDGDDNDTPNDKERSADEDQPNYQNKFERLRKKQSKIEKQNAEYEKQMQLLQLELQQAKQQAKSEPKQTDTSKAKPQAVTDDDVDSYLSEKLGDDWEFMDDSNKRAYKLLAQETLSLRNQPKDNDVEQIVTKRLEEEQKKKQAKSYSNDMDKFVKGLDPDADFIALINEPSFDEFLDGNRVAKAMFVEASSTFDEDSKQIMQDVISSYLGKSALKPLGKTNTSPTVATKSTPEPKRKKRKVSAKAYEEAKVTFKRRPSQRKEALKVIQAYEAQEAEG